MNQNELHQFEHIMTHSPSFDHLFGKTTYIATYFRIIRSSESNYVIRWIFETLVDRSNKNQQIIFICFWSPGCRSILIIATLAWSQSFVAEFVIFFAEYADSIAVTSFMVTNVMV